MARDLPKFGLAVRQEISLLKRFNCGLQASVTLNMVFKLTLRHPYCVLCLSCPGHEFAAAANVINCACAGTMEIFPWPLPCL